MSYFITRVHIQILNFCIESKLSSHFTTAPDLILRLDNNFTSVQCQFESTFQPSPSLLAACISLCTRLSSRLYTLSLFEKSPRNVKVHDVINNIDTSPTFIAQHLLSCSLGALSIFDELMSEFNQRTSNRKYPGDVFVHVVTINITKK